MITLCGDTPETYLFDWLRKRDDVERIGYAEKGMVIKHVHDTLKWKNRIDPETGASCVSFSRWIRLAAPWSYQSCFAAMRDCEALADIPAKELAQIPQANFETLKQLSTAVRAEPSVIKAAQTKRADEFIEHVKRDHPDQHIESRKTLRFVASESEANEIEEAIRLAMERGAMNRTEALMAVCLDYRASVMFDEIVKDLK